jgi:cytochrome b
MKNHKEKKLWDIFVRVFHWSLVTLVLAAFISSDDGGPIHVKVGYAIIAIVLMRIVWGFIGTKHARFTDFVKGPRKVLAYLKGLLTGHPSYVFGHNPAGGLMIVAILFTLLVVGLTGIKTEEGERAEHALKSGDSVGFSLVRSAYADDDFFERDHDDYDDDHGKRGVYRSDGNERSGGANHELWEEAHEFSAFFLLGLIFVHVAAVLLTWLIYGENLIKSMITGRKAMLESGGRAH